MSVLNFVIIPFVIIFMQIITTRKNSLSKFVCFIAKKMMIFETIHKRYKISMYNCTFSTTLWMIRKLYDSFQFVPDSNPEQSVIQFAAVSMNHWLNYLNRPRQKKEVVCMQLLQNNSSRNSYKIACYNKKLKRKTVSFFSLVCYLEQLSEIGRNIHK